MDGPSPWDPYEDAWGLVPWTRLEPVPFQKTEFKFFKISDSDEEGSEPDRYAPLEPESSFDDE